MVPRSSLLTFAIAVGLSGCGGDPNDPGDDPARTWRMGFGAMAPRPTVEDVLATIDAWSPRADAAIMHVGVPWGEMLDGRSAVDHVEGELAALAALYRSRGLAVVFMADPTDGLARENEAPDLVARGRSIAEPEIRELYYDWIDAVTSLVAPDFLGLAAETNLIRAIAPAATYDALVAMTDSSARRVAASPDAPTLFVSVQVETAWGRLAGDGSYAGIAQDLADFPYAEVLGLSSYPYLGGFAEPAQIPLDYYARLHDDAGLPVMVVEGGWPSTSMSMPGFTFESSPAEQTAYIRHQARLLDEADAIGAFQLTFTDLDLDAYPPGPAILPLFASLGLADTELQLKPALAAWDNVFALPLDD
ncbi:MAG TPA: hypothetical protein VF039_09795 [Longimicrobiales bacterium]